MPYGHDSSLFQKVAIAISEMGSRLAWQDR